ncbi:MAG: hypothetical protein NVS1B7_8420 [Candidatus Saccharimonadales bacterium]
MSEYVNNEADRYTVGRAAADAAEYQAQLTGRDAEILLDALHRIMSVRAGLSPRRALAQAQDIAVAALLEPATTPVITEPIRGRRATELVTDTDHYVTMQPDTSADQDAS